MATYWSRKQAEPAHDSRRSGLRYHGPQAWNFEKARQPATARLLLLSRSLERHRRRFIQSLNDIRGEGMTAAGGNGNPRRREEIGIRDQAQHLCFSLRQSCGYSDDKILVGDDLVGVSDGIGEGKGTQVGVVRVLRARVHKSL